MIEAYPRPRTSPAGYRCRLAAAHLMVLTLCIGAAPAGAAPLPKSCKKVLTRSASSDGKRTLITCDLGRPRKLPPIREIDTTDVWLLEPTGLARRLTTSGEGRDAVFSADGKRIALIDRDSLLVVGAAGGAKRVILKASRPRKPRGEYDYYAYSTPTWSPDGRFIAVSGSAGATTVIHVVAVGTRKEVYKSEAEMPSARWQPNGDLHIFDTDEPRPSDRPAVVVRAAALRKKAGLR